MAVARRHADLDAAHAGARLGLYLKLVVKAVFLFARHRDGLRLRVLAALSDGGRIARIDQRLLTVAGQAADAGGIASGVAYRVGQRAADIGQNVLVGMIDGVVLFQRERLNGRLIRNVDRHGLRVVAAAVRDLRLIDVGLDGHGVQNDRVYARHRGIFHRVFERGGLLRFPCEGIVDGELRFGGRQLDAEHRPRFFPARVHADREGVGVGRTAARALALAVGRRGLDHLAVVIIVCQIRVIRRRRQHRQHLGVGIGVIVLAGILEDSGVVIRVRQREGQGREIQEVAVCRTVSRGLGEHAACRIAVAALAEADAAQRILVLIIVCPRQLHIIRDRVYVVDFRDHVGHGQQRILSVSGRIRCAGAPFDIILPILRVNHVGRHEIEDIKAAAAVLDHDTVQIDARRLADAVEFAYGNIGGREQHTVIGCVILDILPLAHAVFFLEQLEILLGNDRKAAAVPLVDREIARVAVGVCEAAAHDQLVVAVVIHVTGGEAGAVDIRAAGFEVERIFAGHHLVVVRAHHDGGAARLNSAAAEIAPRDRQIVNAVLVVVGGGQAHHVRHLAAAVLVERIGPRDFPCAFAGIDIKVIVICVMTRVQIAVTVLLLQLPDLNTRIVGFADVDRDLVDGVAVKVAGRQFNVVLRRIGSIKFQCRFIRSRRIVILFFVLITGITQIQRHSIVFMQHRRGYHTGIKIRCILRCTVKHIALTCAGVHHAQIKIDQGALVCGYFASSILIHSYIVHIDEGNIFLLSLIIAGEIALYLQGNRTIYVALDSNRTLFRVTQRTGNRSLQGVIMTVKAVIGSVSFCPRNSVGLKGEQLVHLRHGGVGFAVGRSGEAFVLLVSLRRLGTETQGIEHCAAGVCAAGLRRQYLRGQQVQAEHQTQQQGEGLCTSAGTRPFRCSSIHAVSSFFLSGGVFLFRHREQLVMAQLHIAEADKDTVGHGAVPVFRVGKRPEADLVQIGLQVQQQTGAGHKVHLQHMIGQRRDGGNVSSLQIDTPFLRSFHK